MESNNTTIWRRVRNEGVEGRGDTGGLPVVAASTGGHGSERRRAAREKGLPRGGTRGLVGTRTERSGEGAHKP